MEFTIERWQAVAAANARWQAHRAGRGAHRRRHGGRRADHQGRGVAPRQPEQVDFFLHPQLDTEVLRPTAPMATGLNVSPGAAVGMIAFDADTAESRAKAGEKVIMVRPETKPDDVHGMLAAKGIVTSRGGRTSHAALVARQFGKPAVVGVSELELDLDARDDDYRRPGAVRKGTGSPSTARTATSTWASCRRWCRTSAIRI